MLYLHPVSLLYVQQPHHDLLTTRSSSYVLYSGKQSYRVGLPEFATQQLIARGRDRLGLEETLDVSDL